jgi:hypothetical protein
MHSTASFLRAIGMGGMFAAVALSVLADDDNPSEWNHFGLDFRMGFNIKAKFTGPAVLAAPSPPPPSAGPAVNRAYSDGFVNVDSSGNAGNLTWNWGYQNPSQISGDTVLMHAASVSSGAGASRSDDPTLGFEVSYVRDLGHECWGRWGIKAAFGYTAIDLCAGGQLITDAYPLNGVVPPIAPYAGSFSGPGVVIGSLPTRSLTGSRKLDATLYDFHLGPTVSLDLAKRLSAELGGGLAVGVMDSTFAFHETPSSGSTSDTGCLVGAYAEAGLAYRVAKAASLFAGAQFQYLGDFNQSVGGRSVQLDLSQSIFCLVGLELHF